MCARLASPAAAARLPAGDHPSLKQPLTCATHGGVHCRLALLQQPCLSSGKQVNRLDPVAHKRHKPSHPTSLLRPTSHLGSVWRGKLSPGPAAPHPTTSLLTPTPYLCSVWRCAPLAGPAAQAPPRAAPSATGLSGPQKQTAAAPSAHPCPTSPAGRTEVGGGRLRGKVGLDRPCRKDRGRRR